MRWCLCFVTSVSVWRASALARRALLTRMHPRRGYRRNAQYPADYMSIDAILSQLVSTVACGGNVLINVGPAADGTIAPLFVERLAQLGTWLGVNGEAIYSSVPWRAQNDTVAPGVWYTTSNATGAVYAVTLGWPAGNVLALGVRRACHSWGPPRRSRGPRARGAASLSPCRRSTSRSCPASTRGRSS